MVEIVPIIISLFTMIITLSYVVITYKQVVASRESVDAMKTQTLLHQQPCIVIENISSSGTEVFNEHGRRQLHINMDLCNIGNAPALSVYVFSHFELANIVNNSIGDNIVNMYYVPNYLSHIKKDEKRTASIRYETEEIRRLLDDLVITYEKNVLRLAPDPTAPHFPGSTLVVEVLYKNQLNQWFSHSYTTEVAWLIDRNSKRTTNNINETTIPPNKLADDTVFELQLTSELFSKSDDKTISSDYIQEKLESYRY